jgi:uncharacterized protein involved in response to NO
MNDIPAGIPRYRATTAPALFKAGYRPFFLAAAAWAVLSLLLWLTMLLGWVSLPTAFDPLAWHAHEMIYGFVVAAIAGFLLTAIPNWTGRFPLQGAPLIALAGLWLAGRIAMASSAQIGALPAALIDLSFLLTLLLAVAREVVAGKNWRNLPPLAALSLLLCGNALTHVEAAGLSSTGALGNRLGLAVGAGMIALVGGRLIPSFTRNYLARRKAWELPAPVNWIDRLALALVVIALAAWVMEAADRVQGTMLLAAAAANALRLSRWCGLSAWRDPLLLNLHLGYGWLVAGLALLGLGRWAEIAPDAAGLHALAAGACGTMILAVMSRTTLAHAGRRQVVIGGTVPLFVLVHMSALARVAATFFPFGYFHLLAVSALAWIAAFALFLVTYGMGLLGQR